MIRLDFITIAEWVPPASNILDLGSGDGSLMKYLRNEKNAKGYGVEISDQNIEKSIANKVNTLQMNLEDGLSIFSDNMFDYVILSQTLQSIVHIEKILAEMNRVGKNIIVTFPNFGYWKNRLQILNGQMPVSKELPYQWYNTPNVHLCTINDFKELCSRKKYKIQHELFLTNNKKISLAPNFFASLALFKITK